jgi:hypothetical protein
MSKKTISDFEDDISEAKTKFFEQLKAMLLLVRNSSAESTQIQDALTDLHSQSVAYFNLFDRSINEYSLEYFHSNQDILNGKINDAIIISNTIIKYWELLQSLQDKFKIKSPQPSERAFSNTQVFIKTFEPDKASDLKSKFTKINLPTYGFDSNIKYTGMKSKNQIKIGIVLGTLFLIVMIIIALLVSCPTKFQSIVFRIILSLAAASFSMILSGSINVTAKKTITATGALAIFVLIYFWNPAKLSDFKSCENYISGTVYFNNLPIQDIRLDFINQSQNTNTDRSGNFTLKVDFSTIDEGIEIRLIRPDIELDTVLSFSKSDLSKRLSVRLKSYCATCIDQQTSVRKCLASFSGYITFLDSCSRKGARIAKY